MTVCMCHVGQARRDQLINHNQQENAKRMKEASSDGCAAAYGNYCTMTIRAFSTIGERTKPFRAEKDTLCGQHSKDRAQACIKRDWVIFGCVFSRDCMK